MKDIKKTKAQLMHDLAALSHEHSQLQKKYERLKGSAEDGLEREKKLESVFASMDDLVFSLDENGIFTDYFQPSDRPELYAKPNNFIGRSFRDVLPPETAELIDDAFAKVKFTKQPQHMDYHLDIAGSSRWYNARLSVIKNQNGDFAGATAVVRDITDRKHAEEMLEKAARIDLLTDLSNRRDFTEKLTNEMSRFKRNGKHFSLVMADIDRFKSINDQYGHECGDHVLQRIAGLLRESLRRQDVIGRWGGEEFVVLLPETNLEGGSAVAEKIRERISSTDFIFKGISFRLTMSFGVSVYDHEMAMKEIVSAADERLYKAKETGRNRVVVR